MPLDNYLLLYVDRWQRNVLSVAVIDSTFKLEFLLIITIFGQFQHLLRIITTDFTQKAETLWSNIKKYVFKVCFKLARKCIVFAKTKSFWITTYMWFWIRATKDLTYNSSKIATFCLFVEASPSEASDRPFLCCRLFASDKTGIC